MQHAVNQGCAKVDIIFEIPNNLRNKIDKILN